MPQKNNEQKNAVLSLIVMSAGILSAVLPFMLHTNMEDWKFGVAFAGIITAITAFFIFLMYNGRAKVQEKILCSIDTLAHFYYPKKFWNKFIHEDIKDSGTGKIIGFFLGAIFTVIGLAVFISDTRANGLFLIIMVCIAVLLVLIGFISSFTEKRRIKSSLPEAIIAKEGLYFKNTLYTWNDKKFSYLESAAYNPGISDCLIFCLRRLSRSKLNIIHYQPLLIRIPVPKGQEYTAGNIIRYFNLPMSKVKQDKMPQENTDISDRQTDSQ